MGYHFIWQHLNFDSICIEVYEELSKVGFSAWIPFMPARVWTHKILLGFKHKHIEFMHIGAYEIKETKPEGSYLSFSSRNYVGWCAKGLDLAKLTHEVSHDLGTPALLYIVQGVGS